MRPIQTFGLHEGHNRIESDFEMAAVAYSECAEKLMCGVIFMCAYIKKSTDYARGHIFIIKYVCDP